jgi:hypothetical protein
MHITEDNPNPHTPTANLPPEEVAERDQKSVSEPGSEGSKGESNVTHGGVEEVRGHKKTCRRAQRTIYRTSRHASVNSRKIYYATDNKAAWAVGQWTQTTLGPIRLGGKLLQPIQMPISSTVITGTVLDQSGHPVAGARVSFVEGPVPLADIAALTAEDGTFSLTAPVAGIYRIACHGDGFRSQSGTVTVVTGTRTTLNFTMR